MPEGLFCAARSENTATTWSECGPEAVAEEEGTDQRCSTAWGSFSLRNATNLARPKWADSMKKPPSVQPLGTVGLVTDPSVFRCVLLITPRCTLQR